jgi:Protein of unknown function (DUF3563)
MSTLWRLIQGLQGLFPHIPTEVERDEAFLAESVDRYDLEWRMHEIAHRHHQSGIGSHWNLGTN